MDFGFNEEQELLRNTARKFLENECTSEFVRARMAEPAGVTDAFWTKLAEQGWTGLDLSRRVYGGIGLGFVDLTVLMEEMGRAVMPGPFFSTCCWGAWRSSRPARRRRRRSGCRRSPAARPRPRWPSRSRTRAGTPPPSP